VSDTVLYCTAAAFSASDIMNFLSCILYFGWSFSIYDALDDFSEFLEAGELSLNLWFIRTFNKGMGPGHT
jgi:hypothetical protein